ncbi:MAG: sensor histidine kinase [Chloroflexota bacterium]
MYITLIYFIYGLAFFSLGLVMWLESRRSPLLVEAGTLLPLAVFGLVHGGHEWIEMFLDRAGPLVIASPPWLGWGRVALLAISFISLMIFGLLMNQPLPLLQTPEQPTRAGRLIERRWAILTGIYIVVVLAVGFLLRRMDVDWMGHLDASVRYALAVPAGLSAGLALLRQSRQSLRLGLSSLSPGLRTAGWGFLLYAATQLVVQPLDVFPGSLVNTTTFLALTGVPVQLLRAAAAVLIAWSLLRVVNAVERERQQQFLAAQAERMDALNRLEEELAVRETMRQELMRSIVIAQEDERSRIARELHDETSQTLTAFSLHLAALKNQAAGSLRERIDLLQQLSQQIAVGIYRLVRDLRPVQLDELGLTSALAALVGDDEKRLGLEVDLEVQGRQRRLAPLVDTVLFRVAQEALTNVARHARVTEAQVLLQYAPEQVQMTISDQGIGFNPAAERSLKGLGLVGMRERVQSVGGELRLQSIPSHGTRVEVVIPLDDAPVETENRLDEVTV